MVWKQIPSHVSKGGGEVESPCRLTYTNISAIFISLEHHRLSIHMVLVFEINKSF